MYNIFQMTKDSNFLYPLKYFFNIKKQYLKFIREVNFFNSHWVSIWHKYLALFLSFIIYYKRILYKDF